MDQESYFRLSFTDLNGIHLSKLVSSKYREKIEHGDCEMYTGMMAFGPRFEVVDIPEIVKRKHVNGRLKPDMSTLHPCRPVEDSITKTKVPVNSVLCNLAWPDGTEIAAHPRVNVVRLLDELEQKHHVKLYSAFEPEFRAFQKGSLQESCLNPKQPIPGQFINLPKPFTVETDMYKTSLLQIYEPYFVSLNKAAECAQIQLQDFSNEDGESMLETPLIPDYGLKSADQYFVFKQIAKEVGLLHNMDITFMTKPLLNSSSCGCHFNHSLWNLKSKQNAFFDQKDPDKLSTFARHWIGGLIAHLPAMTALCCPTVNCYRRLHRHLAPHAANWDINDRFIAIRVKNFDEKRTYIENRVPSSASSPYMVMAATIAAGMDGVERKLEPPQPGLKPSGKESTPDCALLPNTLQESLEILRNDTHFVEKVGPEMVDWFIQVKERGDLKTLGQFDIHDNQELTLAYERNEYWRFI